MESIVRGDNLAIFAVQIRKRHCMHLFGGAKRSAVVATGEREGRIFDQIGVDQTGSSIAFCTSIMSKAVFADIRMRSGSHLCKRLGADCFVVASKRGNARGAKGAGHRRWERANWQQEELQFSTEGGSLRAVARAG
jgi:hypothetical protein